MSPELEFFVLTQVVSEIINIGPSLNKAGCVLNIRTTADYLEFEALLKRLVFIILTYPHQVLCVKEDTAADIKLLEQEATKKPRNLFRTINPGRVSTTDNFV